MNRLQPHPQNSTPPQRPILRAFMMGVALCLLGVALYLETGSILFVVGGAAIAALVTFNALKERRRAAKPQASKIAPRNFTPPKRKSSDAPSRDTTSNVTPFRRPASKSSDDKSNRPSA